MRPSVVDVDADDFENELNRSALWAVTYGDVMSYLMIFFLMNFAFAFSKNVASEFSAQAIEAEFGAQRTAVQEIFSQKGIQQIARMDLQEDRIRLTFNEAVLFDSGAVEVRDVSRPHLERLAEALKEIPNSVQVEGHTDNVPPGPKLRAQGIKSNWELSSARAFSVMRILLEKGVPPSRMSALGYGEFQPVGPNDSDAGRSKNRRIEVNIVRKQAGT